MTLETIVELFGSSKNIHMVSRRVKINKGGPFKGIKTYKIELWDVSNHRILCVAEKTCQITVTNEASIIEEVEQNLLEKMFNLCF